MNSRESHSSFIANRTPPRLKSVVRGRRRTDGGTAVTALAIGALSASVAGLLLVALVPLGPLSTHMACHIAVMNVVAPAATILLTNAPLQMRDTVLGSRWLWSAAALQLVLLWFWHLPATWRWSMSSAEAQFAMHASLFLSAGLFWTTIVRQAAGRYWQSILVLLLTGKIACLLGALLIFAPRLLYTTTDVHAHGHSGPGAITLADQQLAGLLMVVACPLSYLLAGVVIAAQMMAELARHPTTLVERSLPLSLER